MQLISLTKTSNPTIPSGVPLNLTTNTSIPSSSVVKDSIKIINLKIVEKFKVKKESQLTFSLSSKDQRIKDLSVLLVFYKEDEVVSTLTLSSNNPTGTVKLDEGEYELYIYINAEVSREISQNELLSLIQITYYENNKD
jgi:hypothetical protein